MVNSSVKSPYYTPEHISLLTGVLTAVQFGWVGPGGGDSWRNLRVFAIPVFCVSDHRVGSAALHLPRHDLKGLALYFCARRSQGIPER